jgi:hypothetical protein
MRKPRLFIAAPLLALAVAAACPAYAEHGLEASMAACPQDGTAIGGVNSCGKIWNIKKGEAELDHNGKLEIEVHGLVLNDPTLPADVNGTADGVTEVVGSVVCSGGGASKVVAETGRFPLSKSGDAKIKARVSLPKGCVAPIILVREIWEGKIGGWLAATGF